MTQSPLKLPASRKNIAILVLALSASSTALASSYNFRVTAPGLKPSAAVVPPGPTIPQLNFTSCGQGGRFGPTLVMCQTAYAAQAALLASLAMPGYQGYQEWTVPATGNYTITAAGAGGGTTPQSGVVGGRGAILRGTFNLTVGTVLQIVVGQAGITAQSVSPAVSYTDAGGGGGTFVVKKAGNVPLLVAGGGGGANYYVSGQYYGSGGDGGSSTTAGAPPASVNGGGTNFGEPGGGFSADGALPGWGTGALFTIAQGFNSGAVGGISTQGNGNGTANRFGGFGGGAGAHGNNCIGGGAGGGYVGGIGSASCGGGGGGSSFISSAATNKGSSSGSYEGGSLGSSALGYVPASTAGFVTIVQN